MPVAGPGVGLGHSWGFLLLKAIPGELASEAVTTVEKDGLALFGDGCGVQETVAEEHETVVVQAHAVGKIIDSAPGVLDASSVGIDVAAVCFNIVAVVLDITPQFIEIGGDDLIDVAVKELGVLSEFSDHSGSTLDLLDVGLDGDVDVGLDLDSSAEVAIVKEGLVEIEFSSVGNKVAAGKGGSSGENVLLIGTYLGSGFELCGRCSGCNDGRGDKVFHQRSLF